MTVEIALWLISAAAVIAFFTILEHYKPRIRIRFFPTRTQEAPMPTHDPKSDETQMQKALPHEEPVRFRTGQAPSMGAAHDADRKVTNIFTDGGDLNNVAHLREQDQAIAQLGAQLDAMTGSPWQPVAASEMYSADCRQDGTPIRKVTQQLGCMNVQYAVVGTQNANVGIGSVSWIQVGPRAVTVSGEAKAAVQRSLNEGYARIIGPRQAALIASIHAYAKGQGDLPSAGYELAIKANTTFVVCADEDDRQQLLAQLKASYDECIKDARALIMAELLNATRPTVKPTMR